MNHAENYDICNTTPPRNPRMYADISASLSSQILMVVVVVVVAFASDSNVREIGDVDEGVVE